MYHFHHTPGIIIASRLSGEANRQVRIFTRELGMVTVHAQGIRLLSSKLRYALQPYSLCELALVHGRHGWRVTNAIPLFSYGAAVAGQPRSRKSMVSILAFLARFTPDSVIERELFDDVAQALTHLVESTLSSKEEDQICRVVELKALFAFGYVQSKGSITDLVTEVFTGEMVTRSLSHHKEIDEAIRLGVYESHL